jgi:hypothetical protein
MKLTTFEINIHVKQNGYNGTPVKFSLLIPDSYTTSGALTLAIEEAAKKAIAAHVEEKDPNNKRNQ